MLSFIKQNYLLMLSAESGHEKFPLFKKKKKKSQNSPFAIEINLQSFPVTCLSQMYHSVDSASAAVIFSQLSVNGVFGTCTFWKWNYNSLLLFSSSWRHGDLLRPRPSHHRDRDDRRRLVARLRSRRALWNVPRQLRWAYLGHNLPPNLTPTPLPPPQILTRAAPAEERCTTVAVVVLKSFSISWTTVNMGQRLLKKRFHN